MHKNINEQVSRNEEKNLYGKRGDGSEKLNLNSDSEGDSSDRDDTKNLINRPNCDDDMASFDKKAVQSIQKNRFHRSILKFFILHSKF